MRVLDNLGREKVTPRIPRGIIAVIRNATIPADWALCDGTDGTPDLRDRIIVGDTAVGLGTAAGTVSFTAALTHSGLAVADHADHVIGQAASHGTHVVGSPVAHAAHVVGQPSAHATHTANATHTHDAHTTGATLASTRTVLTGPATHAPNTTHTHDAHSAHTGAAVDAHAAHTGAALAAHSAHAGGALTAHSAHSVTQASAHAVPLHFVLAWAMHR